jgi:DNA-binding PadR family transcriptional regulator
VNETLKGNDIRASYAAPSGGGMQDEIIRLLTRRGPSPTRDIKQYIGGKARPGQLTEILAGLVDDGKIVAVRKPTTARGGRPGVVYQLA